MIATYEYTDIDRLTGGDWIVSAQRQSPPAECAVQLDGWYITIREWNGDSCRRWYITMRQGRMRLQCGYIALHTWQGTASELSAYVLQMSQGGISHDAAVALEQTLLQVWDQKK